MSPAGPDRWTFYAILPRRYDASGKVPGRGLFLNGLWHPQPVASGSPAVVNWEVHLSLPQGVVGALNGEVGEGELFWSGEAERLSLTAIPNGRVEEIPLAKGSLRLLTRGPKRNTRNERLAMVAESAFPEGPPSTLLVVDSPSRRRLVRAGPSQLYLSDRAFRVNLGLWRHHASPVRRGLLEAGLAITDPWERGLAAAGIASVAEESADELRAKLGWASWIPQVDELLYDGRLPFYPDVFGETWSGDPVRDDLLELLSPLTPPLVVARRLDLRYGEGTAARLGLGLSQGESLELAARRAGIETGVVELWRPAPPPESLSVHVLPGEAETTIAVIRGGPAELQAAPIAIELTTPRGPEQVVWEAPNGPGEWFLKVADPPELVRVDPLHTEHQPERSDDRWPTRWTTTAAFFPTEWAVAAKKLSLAADLSFRRQFDSRRLYLLGASTDPVDRLAVSLGMIRYLGPLQDRRNRPLRIWGGFGPSLLDPAFRPTDGNGLALGGYVGIAHETRTDPEFPRSGHRVWVGGSGGFLADGAAGWGAMSTGGIQLLPLGGRMTLASKASLALAKGDVAHRLLVFGGGDAYTGLAAVDAVGRQRYLAGTELRGQVLRFTSVPGPLVWLSDVQVSLGLEAGHLGGLEANLGEGGSPTNTDPWTIAGWTAGLACTGDVFGARPTLLGIWFGSPLWSNHADHANELQSYLRMTQPF